MIATRDFWARVSRPDPDSCWTWQGPTDSRGYGHLRWDGRANRAHRVAFEIMRGVILPRNDRRYCVLHSCDNKLCCNPAHLRVGSHAENMMDMKVRGRRKGIAAADQNGRAKLTSEQVVAIKRDPRGKIKLSREYGVSPAQIQRIRAGKQWQAIA